MIFFETKSGLLEELRCACCPLAAVKQFGSTAVNQRDLSALRLYVSFSDIYIDLWMQFKIFALIVGYRPKGV